MKHLTLVFIIFLLCGCAIGIETTYNDNAEPIKKDSYFRLMQMPTLENHASAQSTVGIGASVRFTDHSGAVTPKFDIGYFRHATGLDPILFAPEKRLGNMVISTAADITGEGITDDVAFGEAALVEHHEKGTAPSMFESMIAELTAMKESANDTDKAKYQSNIDFLKTVLGGIR